jgi:hypothetical protein
MSKPYIHAQSSAKRFGGKPIDYIAIHQLLDLSKATFCQNLHRCLLHSSWGTFIIEEIFGKMALNSESKSYFPRSVAEFHILEDFIGHIPSLLDYIKLIPENEGNKKKLEAFQKENPELFPTTGRIGKIMMSPLWNTGKINGLFVTHNSFFVGEILPLLDFTPIQKDYSIAPADFLSQMEYPDWINGKGKLLKEENKPKKLEIDVEGLFKPVPINNPPLTMPMPKTPQWPEVPWTDIYPKIID